MKANWRKLGSMLLSTCIIMLYAAPVWADNIENGDDASAGRDETYQYKYRNGNDDNIAIGEDALAGNGGTVTKTWVPEYKMVKIDGKYKKVECGGDYEYKYTPGNNDNNIAIGKNAQAGNGTENSDNTAVGVDSMAGNGNGIVGATAIGKGAKATVDYSTALGAGSSATAENSVALGHNSKTGDRRDTVSVGNSDLQRQITNLAPGTAGTDAVNVNQLKSVESSLNARIDNTDLRLDRVGALASAFSALAPMPYDAAQPTQMSIGAGIYSGEQAIALGVYHYTKNDVLFNAGFAISGSEKMGRAGVTWKIGGKKTAPADAVVIAPVTLTNDSDITTRVKRILEESDSI